MAGIGQVASKSINTILRPLKLELRRASTEAWQPVRHSLGGALEHVRNLGFSPATAIDVGVATGTFEIYEAFPNARHLLVEPVAEFKPAIDKIVSSLANAEH